jgi:hypothetical protein
MANHDCQSLMLPVLELASKHALVRPGVAPVQPLTRLPFFGFARAAEDRKTEKVIEPAAVDPDGDDLAAL